MKTDKKYQTILLVKKEKLYPKRDERYFRAPTKRKKQNAKASPNRYIVIPNISKNGYKVLKIESKNFFLF